MAGVLSGLEDRDDPPGSWGFDPLSLRHSLSNLTVHFHPTVAQLVERRVEGACVAGSIPARGTISTIAVIYISK